MQEAIIGGAIAAVIGAVAGVVSSLWLSHRNSMREQVMMVSELLVEVEQNLKICIDPTIRNLWWTVKYKTDAYDRYKGRIGFLSKEIREELAAIVYLVEPVNSSVDVHRWMSALRTNMPTDFKPIPKFDPLEKSLLFCQKELKSWLSTHNVTS